MAELVFGDLSPEAALRAFDQRGLNPLTSYSWADVMHEMHAQQFTVAKTAGYDVLDDIMSAMREAEANGETFDTFSKNLMPILRDKGWWGIGPAFDPVTGETTMSQLGSLRRLRIIYDTNMRTSYAAGKWAGIEDNKADQPYLMYAHTTSEHPRIEHLAWDGTALPVDHPWWLTHYPPNGWGCKCGVIALSQAQYDRMNGGGLLKTVAPALDLRSWINPRTLEELLVPKGIDPGFGYNVGKAFLDKLAG